MDLNRTVTDFHEAIRHKDLKMVKLTVDKVDLNAKSDIGFSALHVAAKTNDADILKLILKQKKVEMNLIDPTGNTPLMITAEEGSFKAFEVLIKGGADPALKGSKGTILHVLLAKKKWRSDEKKILKKVIPVIGKEGINVPAGPTQETALQMACMRGEFDMALLLLKNRADPTVVKGGDPPLFGAVNAENTKLFKALLEAGADIAQHNSKGQTLIEQLNPKSEMYKLLKKRMLSAPGGERKLKMVSEHYIVAKSTEELPQDVKRLVNASKLSYDKIGQNWPLFCNIIYFVAKKRIFASQEEADSFKAKQKERQMKKEVGLSPRTKALQSEIVTPGNPKKLFKNMQIAGRGGFGMVFAGTAPDKSRVAIKRMPHTSDRERKANIREVQFLRTCTHPNICAYKATYESVELHEIWVTMELLEGGNLDEAILGEEGSANFQEQHIAYIAREMLCALVYLHDRHIAHRDLKSANVMLDVEGRIKLIDFGLAMEIDPKNLPLEMCGSPFWMPPEMILQKPHSFPVDIWSMAVCLLELANRHPPEDDSALRALFSVGTSKAPALDEPAKWGELFKDFLGFCLAFDPLNRQTADQLLRHRFIAKACRVQDMQALLRAIFASYSLDEIKLI